MTLRSTQQRGFTFGDRKKQQQSIKGSQAHSLIQAQKFGNEERKVVTLPRLKFMEKPLDEET